MSQSLVITSGKGGVGKTTTCANLGVALASMGAKVVMVDADIGLRNLDVVMGLENRIVYDLVDVVEGYCRMRQALIKDKRVDGLFLLPAAQTKDKNAVNPDQMKELMGSLKEEHDFVLVDCPAIAGADRAVIVTTPEVSAVRDADRITGLLEASGFEKPELIINRLKPKMVARGDMMDIPDIIDILAIDLLGVVPDDDYIVVSTNRGEPAVMADTSKAGEAYRNIARRIRGEEVPFMDLTEKESIWERLRRIVRLG